jgi:hypothetical protein
MKIITITLLALTVATSSFSNHAICADENGSAGQKLANHIVDALQRQSAETFVALFPTVEEFYAMMEKNAKVYGPFLQDAQLEFAHDYMRNLIPSLHDSFTALLAAGAARGIVWHELSLVSVHVNERGKNQSVTLVVASGGNEHKIILEKPLWIDGRLKISQFVKLV